MQSTVIIGGGPGGLGPLIWAAQSGALAEWLGKGVTVIDRQPSLGGTLGRYAINSDSLGGAYLEFLDAAGTPSALKQLRDDAVTRRLKDYHDSFPPLDLVDRFLRRLGAAIDALISAQAGCAIWNCTDVQSLHLRQDGSLEIRAVSLDGTTRRVAARAAIVALGGRQIWKRQPLVDGLTLASCRPRYAMPSDRLLSHAGLKEAERVLQDDDGRPVVILGGSHSAYSAAWTLTNLLSPQALGRRRVLIMERRPPRIFYPSRAAAEADGYEVTAGDICPRTERVNRLSGLRSDGRDTWRRVTGRYRGEPESRIATVPLADLSAGELRAILEDAALVVPAFGYRSATLPIFDGHGRRLSLNADAGGRGVAQDCRLLLADGTSLSNVFGIGLGTGFRPHGAMGGEPNFDGQANSLWLYQNGIGATVHRGILDCLASPLPSSRPTQRRPQPASELWPIAVANAPQSAR